MVEFRADRSWHAGWRNLKTGVLAPGGGTEESTWRFDGATLVTTNHREGRPSGEVFGRVVLGPTRVVDHTMALAWDGPTRLRWRTVGSDGTDTWTSSGTWTRVTDAP